MLLAGAILLALFVVPAPWGWLLVPAALAWEIGQLVVGVRWAQRRRANRVVGRTGRVRSPGVVEIRGELWPAPDAPAEVGRAVVVVATDGRTVTVEPR